MSGLQKHHRISGTSGVTDPLQPTAASKSAFFVAIFLAGLVWLWLLIFALVVVNDQCLVIFVVVVMTKIGGFLSNNPYTSRRSCEGGEDNVSSDIVTGNFCTHDLSHRDHDMERTTTFGHGRDGWFGSFVCPSAAIVATSRV